MESGQNKQEGFAQKQNRGGRGPRRYRRGGYRGSRGNYNQNYYNQNMNYNNRYPSQFQSQPYYNPFMQQQMLYRTEMYICSRYRNLIDINTKNANLYEKIDYSRVIKLFGNIEHYNAIESEEFAKLCLDFYLMLLHNYSVSETDLKGILAHFVGINFWDDLYNEKHPLVKIFREILIYRHDLNTFLEYAFINNDRIPIWKYAPINSIRCLSENTYNELYRYIIYNLHDMAEFWQPEDYINFFSDFFASRHIKYKSIEQFIKDYIGEDIKTYSNYTERVTSMFKILCNNIYLTEDAIYLIYRELKHLVKHKIVDDVKSIYACLYYNNNCSKKLKNALKDKI